MKINFASIYTKGSYILFEVAPNTAQQASGSFMICTSSNNDLKLGDDITGSINGAAISLFSEGKPLPRELRIGNKSISQLKLWQFGYHIPSTIALDYSFFDAFKQAGKVDLQELFNQEIARWTTQSLAVRCSSNLEDSDTFSFAGVFDTYLNVPNRLEAIQEKILRSYRRFAEDMSNDLRRYALKLGVIVQTMVQPKFSGFLFTVDPMNPPNDWLKIEYWQGQRESSDGYSITLNRNSGKRIRSGRDDSQVLLPIVVQEQLYHAAVDLDRNFGSPQDAEFLISDDDTLYLIQSRPITAFSYSPDKVRVNEQHRLSDILRENQNLYGRDPTLSSTNISELFTYAAPLGYSVFRYGFAGTREHEGGISIGRSRLGYARLDPEDQVNLFYTVADQARTNIIVDALTFRLPGISKRDYLDTFVDHYLKQIRKNPGAANYPEDGLYLQTDDPERWLKIAGEKAEGFRTAHIDFMRKLTEHHAPQEYKNASGFFDSNERHYRSWLDRDLHLVSDDALKQELSDILAYLRAEFCPQYVVYARLAFLFTHVARVKLDKLLLPNVGFTGEQMLNELLRSVKIPHELEGPQYPEFERLFKLGRISLAEFLNRFQHLGSLDITQPRLGEYPIEKLYTIFGPDREQGSYGESTSNDKTPYMEIDVAVLGLDIDAEFRDLYVYGARFMRLREKAKFELLKVLWVLKRVCNEFAGRHRLGDLIYYLDVGGILALTAKNREASRLYALQQKAYFGACRQHRVKDILLDLRSTPFEAERSHRERDDGNPYKFAKGQSIFYGQAEGLCLTAKSNEEFYKKLADYRERKIENIIGVFKGMELSYFNLSALKGFTTENGGFLSHAATIAREFRLPYISGIRVDDFQDGDYLILDTENEQVIYRR